MTFKGNLEKDFEYFVRNIVKLQPAEFCGLAKVLSVPTMRGLQEIGLTVEELKGKTKEEAQEHLDIILGGTNVLYSKSENIQNRYENKLIYPNGLYETFKDYKFIEKFGEYEQGSGPSANNITKRVITYILINP